MRMRILVSTISAAALAAALVAVIPATAQQYYGHGSGMGPGYGPGMMGGYGMGPGMMAGYGMGPGMPGGMPSGYGMGPGMPGGYGMGPGMMHGYGGNAGAPDLTDDQREKIIKIHEALSAKQWELMGKMQDQQFKLRDLMASGKADDATVGKTYKNIEDLRQQVWMSGVDAQKQIEAVIGKAKG